MTDFIHETPAAATGVDHRIRNWAMAVAAIMVAAVVALAASTSVDRPGTDPSAATADSYRQYAEAMSLQSVAQVGSGAVTADSYRRYAEAMSLHSVSEVNPSTVTADSYRQYAEALQSVPQVGSGAATAASYRRFAEAMSLVR